MGTIIVNRALDPNAFASSLNLLANGGFEQWNRGTPIVNPTSVTYTADKWLIYAPGGTPTLTISRDNSTFDSGLYSMQVNCTATGGITTLMIYQVIDSFTGLLVGQTVTCSMRVKTSIANAIRIRILDTAGGANASFSSYHTGSGNWETLSVTRTIGSSGFANVAVGIISPDTVVTGQWWIDSAMLVTGGQALSFVPDNIEIDKTKIGGLSAIQANLPNLLDNGGFGAGQKYAGIQFNPSANTVVVDRWKTLYATSGVQPTFSYQRAADGNQAHAIRFNCSVVGTGSLNDGRFAYQALDADIDVLVLRGQQISLSMWMKSSTNQAGLQLQYGPGLFGYAYHSGGSNWEYLTCTVTVDASATVITVGAFAPNATCDIWINNAMLVVGGIPMPYVQGPAAVELMRCLRYYEASGPRFEHTTVIGRYSGVNYLNYYSVAFAVLKSATPTVTISGLGVVLAHFPTTGNTVSGDTVNWTINTTPGAGGFYYGLTRTGDQTTYPMASVEFDWKAEVT